MSACAQASAAGEARIAKVCIPTWQEDRGGLPPDLFVNNVLAKGDLMRIWPLVVSAEQAETVPNKVHRIALRGAAEGHKFQLNAGMIRRLKQELLSAERADAEASAHERREEAEDGGRGGAAEDNTLIARLVCAPKHPRPHGIFSALRSQKLTRPHDVVQPETPIADPHPQRVAAPRSLLVRERSIPELFPPLPQVQGPLAYLRSLRRIGLELVLVDRNIHDARWSHGDVCANETTACGAHRIGDEELKSGTVNSYHVTALNRMLADRRPSACAGGVEDQRDVDMHDPSATTCFTTLWSIDSNTSRDFTPTM
mmetsp:Transcript_71870/g.208272  ORF Transcript_71870/g.208272 Transcript_71870/m.208272 type:complete len:312 (+) Transcript_71870:39-974(+)